MNMIELFGDHTFRTVFCGTAIIGAVSGALGCFTYLRKQSLVGDVVSHSSLFGIMLFFLLSYLITGEGNKSLYVLIPGAVFAGVLSLVLVKLILKWTRVREDSGLGVMLAIFFGAGIFLLRWTQNAKQVIPGRSGLSDYIFGMAAAMTIGDLIMITLTGVVTLALVLACWKELKVFTFDREFSQGLGIKSTLLDYLFIVTLVVGVVVGIQSIGVVLMIAMLVTPAAAARQWARSLGGMVSLAALFGFFAGGTGSVISASYSNLPTGPIIVLCGIVIFILSIFFAPRRGIIPRKLLLRKKAELKVEVQQ